MQLALQRIDDSQEQNEAELSEEQLIQRFKEGDSDAFRILYEHYYQRLYFSALKILKKDEDVKDILQQAFLKAYTKIETFKGNSSFFTWMYTIVRNLSLNFIRSRTRRREEYADDGVFGLDESARFNPQRASMSPEVMAINRQFLESLDRAVADLSPSRSRIFELFYVNGRSCSQIATIMDCSEGTVKSDLFRIRKQLQASLGEHI